MNATFKTLTEDHHDRVRNRGYALAAEHAPPVGQAGFWYDDVVRNVPKASRLSGQLVARQIARLCGDDAKVTVSWRSLSDAVGQIDSAGRPRAFTERGVRVLVESGWLRVTTTGSKREARTTFWLVPGDRFDVAATWAATAAVA